MTPQLRVLSSPSDTDGRVSLRPATTNLGQLDRDAIQENIANRNNLSRDSSQRQDAEFAWMKCGVPDRHRKQLLNLDARAEWVAAADKVAAKLGSGFIAALLGPRGTGKTQIATHLIHLAIGAGMSARYMLALDFFLALRGAMQRDGIGEDRLILEHTKRHLLVIDEAGVRGHSEWEDRNLTHLIDRRYGAMVDTLLISNETPDRFRETVGHSVADRIRECGGVIECNWSSFRGR